MAAKEQDFETFAGSEEALDFSLTWEDGDDYDLTSSVISWVLATRAGSTPILTKTLDSGITVTHAQGEGPNPAMFQVTIDPEDTESLEGLYYHEARVDDMPVATGLVTVLPSSTREFGS